MSSLVLPNKCARIANIGSSFSCARYRLREWEACPLIDDPLISYSTSYQGRLELDSPQGQTLGIPQMPGKLLGGTLVRILASGLLFVHPQRYLVTPTRCGPVRQTRSAGRSQPEIVSERQNLEHRHHSAPIHSKAPPMPRHTLTVAQELRPDSSKPPPPER